jgi:signal transduction histidine kinase
MCEFDAAEIAHDIGELYEPLAEEKGIAPKVEADAPAPLKGIANLSARRSPIWSIIPSNTRSRVALALNGAPAQIIVRAVSEGDRILLTVADSGPGIPEADRTRVIERFVEASRVVRSLGPGLV